MIKFSSRVVLPMPSRVRCFSPFLLLVTLVLPTVLTMNASSALTVTGLYSYEIPVNNESNAERSRAFREAMEAVIVKVSGDARWLEQTEIRSALSRAQSYVEEVRYRRDVRLEPEFNATASEQANSNDLGVELSAVSGLAAVDANANAGVANSADSPIEDVNNPESSADLGNVADTLDNIGANSAQGDAEPANTAAQLIEVQQDYLQVTFARDLIDDLLADAEVPVWDNNRPSLLVWMVLQDDSGERSYLNRESGPELLQVIEDFANARGLPVIFPLLDFEDQRNLRLDALWGLEDEDIVAASGRYGPDSILAGRLHMTATNDLVGRWKFFFQDTVETYDGVETELQAYLHQPLDRITAQLSSHFAVVRSASEQQNVRLRIEDVSDLSAYSGLMNYLGSLGLVNQILPASLQGKAIELELSLLGSRNQLYELIALDRNLLPVESTMNESRALLHYRWTR